MSEKKIDNTFMRAMDQVNSLEKVFREGGLLEKAVMDIKGDVAWLKDIREALSNAYESLEDGHQGTTGHLDVPEEKSIMEEVSPVYHTDKITKPLFVAQGANDPRVNIDESELN